MSDFDDDWDGGLLPPPSTEFWPSQPIAVAPSPGHAPSRFIGFGFLDLTANGGRVRVRTDQVSAIADLRVSGISGGGCHVFLVGADKPFSVRESFDEVCDLLGWGWVQGS